MSATQIRSRKPTCVVPYPFVLLEGEEKSGKSWAAILLSASPRVGATYVIDLGEGGADEYGAIPGARFEIIDHDGTYHDILGQVEAVKAEAARAKAAGDPPVVLVLDTMTDVWEGLKDWAAERARGQSKNKAKLAQDPHAEVDVSRNLWNDAGARYRRLMTALLTFPGIVVATARGKEISATDPTTGQPYRDGRRDYRVESHKTLPFDATVWVRMFRTERPLVVGCRSVHTGIRPGRDEPMRIEVDADNLLDWLIFDALKVDPTVAHVRDIRNLTGGELTIDERADEEAEHARERRAADEAASTAQNLADLATKCGDIDKLRRTYSDARSVLLDLPVAVAAEHCAVAGAQPGRLTLKDWLTLCASVVSAEGMSVADYARSQAADDPWAADAAGRAEMTSGVPA